MYTPFLRIIILKECKYLQIWSCFPCLSFQHSKITFSAVFCSNRLFFGCDPATQFFTFGSSNHGGNRSVPGYIHNRPAHIKRAIQRDDQSQAGRIHADSSQHDHQHDQQRDQIPVLPLQLGHEGKVHSPQPHQERRRDEQSRRHPLASAKYTRNQQAEAISWVYSSRIANDHWLCAEQAAGRSDFFWAGYAR